MPTFFVDRYSLAEKKAWLEGESAHHLSRVLRVHVGEEIKFATDTNRLFVSRVAVIDRDSIELSILREVPAPPAPFDINLFLAVLKSDKMEWIVEKAVELNIAKVTLVMCERSVRNEVSDKKMERLQKIAQSAQKQCGRLIPLIIEGPVDFDVAVGQGHLKHLFCSKSERSQDFLSLKNSDSSIMKAPIGLWIGPEGGWSVDEIKSAENLGFHFVVLGSLTLRAETAAVSAMSIASQIFYS